MSEGEIDLTPDYAKLRKQFSREARIKADTILANLLPEHMIEPHLIKGVQFVVLREFQAILHSIAMVTQCTVNGKDLLGLRELTSEVLKTIIAKADQIERDMAAENAPEQLFRVFNVTDGLYANPNRMNEAEAAGFIEGFRDRFREQGYYKTAEGERISPDDVVLELRPVVDVSPPHTMFLTSDGYTLRWSQWYQVWFTGKTWDDRDMEFEAAPNGWPVTDLDEEVDGDYIKEGE